MFERDDERGADVAPPQPDERLGGGNYADGPRSRLGGALGGESPERSFGKESQRNFLLSLLGQDPATRKLMGGALAIVILLLLSVGVWSLFGEKHHQGVPVIAPPSIALKDRPSDPGGMQVMSDDSLQGDVTGKGEVHLAPPAEQPDERVLARKDGQSVTSPAQHPLQSDIPSTGKNTPEVATVPVPPASEPAKGLQSDMGALEGTKPQTARSEPEKRVERPSESAKKAAPPREEHREAKAKISSQTLPPPKALPVTGVYQVQLAALESKAKAQQTWARLQKRYPELFGKRTALYSQTSRKGHTFIRLRTSGFADLKAAKAFCAKVQAHSVSCTPAFF